MGELHDFGTARRDRDSKRGIKPGVIDRLADALGLRGDKPTAVTSADLEQVVDLPEVDSDVKQVAREISDLLNNRVHEIVEGQESKEE